MEEGEDQPPLSNRLNSKSDQSHNGHISGKVLGICSRIVAAKHSHRRLLTLLIHLQARERGIRDPVLPDPRARHVQIDLITHSTDGSHFLTIKGS